MKILQKIRTSFTTQLMSWVAAFEIRTPLNIINGFAQVLIASYQDLPPEELADITGRMQDSADDISRLARKLGEA